MISPRPLIVVEDDPEVRASLRFWLQAEGHEVSAFDTAQALREARWPESGVFIVDEHLPDGSGIDLIRALRLAGHAIPSVVITTNPSAQLRSSCADASVPIVEKPLISNELLEAIARVSSSMPDAGPTRLS